MGNLLQKFRQKDVRIILLGLDSAGKTTILYRLKLDDVVTTVPTIGFNVETIHYKDMHMTAWDIGSKDKVYYKGADAVVFVIDSHDPERLDELNHDVVKPAVGAEELTSAVFLFLANKMDLPAAMTTEQISDRLGLRFLKHPWGILPVSAISGAGLQAALEWLAVRLGSRQVRATTFASPKPRLHSSQRTRPPVKQPLSVTSSSASSNATNCRADSLKRGSMPQKPVIMLNSRLYREGANVSTTSASSASRMSVSGESNQNGRRGSNYDQNMRRGSNYDQNMRRGSNYDQNMRRGSNYDQNLRRGSNYDQNLRRGSQYDQSSFVAPRPPHGSVVNCFSSYSIAQSMREESRGNRKFSTISQSDIRRLSCASLTVDRRESSASLQERFQPTSNGMRKMSSASLADGTPYKRKLSTSFIIDPPNYRKFSSASLMESPFARKQSDASIIDDIYNVGARKLSSVSQGSGGEVGVATPPLVEDARPSGGLGVSYLSVTPNVVATPPTDKRKQSVELALQGFGAFTPMMADYIHAGLKDSDTSADSLNLASSSSPPTDQPGGSGVSRSILQPRPSNASLLRKSSLRYSAGRYSVNRPLSAAAAHKTVDQYTEELHKLMPEKYGSLAAERGSVSQTTAFKPRINTSNIVSGPSGLTRGNNHSVSICTAGTGNGTDGGSDSGADIVLPVPSPSRKVRRESLLDPKVHGYDMDFTLIASPLPLSGEPPKRNSNVLTLTSAEERKYLKMLASYGRKLSAPQERRKSKSSDSLRGQQRRHSRVIIVAPKDFLEQRKSVSGVSSRQERRHSKASRRASKEHDRRHSKSTSKSEERRLSRARDSKIEEEEKSSPRERKHSRTPGAGTSTASDDRRHSRTRRSPGASPRGNRRQSKLSRPQDNSALQGRRGSRIRGLDTTTSTTNSSSSCRSRSSSRDSSDSSDQRQKSSSLDLFTCSPIHKRWGFTSYSCRGKSGSGRKNHHHRPSSRKSHQNRVSVTSTSSSPAVPSCFSAYNALRCFFFSRSSRTEQGRRHSSQNRDDDDNNSVSSDDDADLGDDDSERDGDDEAEEGDERADAVPLGGLSGAATSSSYRGITNARPQAGFTRDLLKVPVVCDGDDDGEDDGLPRCGVTVTVEEVDEVDEETDDKDGDFQCVSSADLTKANDNQRSEISLHDHINGDSGIGSCRTVDTIGGDSDKLMGDLKNCPHMSIEESQDANGALHNQNSNTPVIVEINPMWCPDSEDLVDVDEKPRPTLSQNNDSSIDSRDKCDVSSSFNESNDDETDLENEILVEFNECFENYFLEDKAGSTEETVHVGGVSYVQTTNF